jgi:sugar (pentulose or hexulose) kinase
MPDHLTTPVTTDKPDTTTGPYFLSIDNGTQSVRALVFDTVGTLVAKHQIEIEAYVSPQPGWAEQNADYFWQKVCEACQGLWPKLEIPREEICAVSVTTQRGTVVSLDKHGKPLRPAISWLDQRQADKIPSSGLVGLGMRCLGLGDLLSKLCREAESNWIAEHQPDIARDTSSWLLLSGYLTYQLTGKLNDAVASQVGFIPFDYKNQRWCQPDNWRYHALSVSPEQLPNLESAGQSLGTINAAAAAATGIPEGIALIAAGSDKACEVLGSGCIDNHVGSVSYGTTATFNVSSKRYFEAVPFHPAFPAVVPNMFNIETMVHRGYWMVNWFKKEFGLREELIAKEKGIAPEVLFDDLLRAVPPGSMGLVLQPYWSSGVNSEGPEAKGAIVGFGDVHTRAHIYRAIIEGIAYALRDGMQRLEKRGKLKIDRLRVSGGGSQSDEILQMTADIFGLPAEKPHTYETSGLGAAIAAAVGTGVYPDFDCAVKAMVHCGKRFEPRQEQVSIYNKLFKQVYQKLYKQLRPSYRAIRNITGYPN